MKRVAFQFAVPASRAIAATALLATLVFSSASRAASADLVRLPAAGAPQSTLMVADAAPMQASPPSAASPAKMDKESAERVEAQIKHLHEKLQITPAQEGMWSNVAQVMRDNADKLTSLAIARSENAKTMTAVDDLKSYAAITEAHEAGMEKLLPVFTTLYDSMSDVQKKAADEEFRHHHEHEHEHHRHAHS
jgi:hypothetical protein